MSDYLIHELDRYGVAVRGRSEIADLHGVDGELEAVTLQDGTRLALSFLFLFLGASPCTSWVGDTLAVDEDGFVLTGAAAGGSGLLETSVPGIFAVGDVRSGSIKRCATAVGEGAMVVRYLHDHLASLAPVGSPRCSSAEGSSPRDHRFLTPSSYRRAADEQRAKTKPLSSTLRRSRRADACTRRGRVRFATGGALAEPAPGQGVGPSAAGCAVPRARSSRPPLPAGRDRLARRRRQPPQHGEDRVLARRLAGRVLHGGRSRSRALARQEARSVGGARGRPRRPARLVAGAAAGQVGDGCGVLVELVRAGSAARRRAGNAARCSRPPPREQDDYPRPAAPRAPLRRAPVPLDDHGRAVHADASLPPRELASAPPGGDRRLATRCDQARPSRIPRPSRRALPLRRRRHEHRREAVPLRDLELSELHRAIPGQGRAGIRSELPSRRRDRAAREGALRDATRHPGDRPARPQQPHLAAGAEDVRGAVHGRGAVGGPVRASASLLITVALLAVAAAAGRSAT